MHALLLFYVIIQLPLIIVTDNCADTSKQCSLVQVSSSLIIMELSPVQRDELC